ncbi:MAG: hypothetical protein ACXQTX_03135, partial [Candidatus Syntropharchaeia archaeon]
NIRFHESLDTKHYLQTPEDAFWSRLPVEARLGLHSSFLVRWLGMRGRLYKVKNFESTQARKVERFI